MAKSPDNARDYFGLFRYGVTIPNGLQNDQKRLFDQKITLGERVLTGSLTLSHTSTPQFEETEGRFSVTKSPNDGKKLNYILVRYVFSYVNGLIEDKGLPPGFREAIMSEQVYTDSTAASMTLLADFDGYHAGYERISTNDFPGRKIVRVTERGWQPMAAPDRKHLSSLEFRSCSSEFFDAITFFATLINDNLSKEDHGS